MEVKVLEKEKVFMTEEQFMDIQSQLRPRVNSLYDMQKQRIAAGGRIVSEFYAKMGIKPGKKINDVLESDDPDDAETQEEQKKAMKVLDVLKLEHKRITDVIANDVKKAEEEKILKTIFKTGQLITNKSELIQARYYFDLCQFEKELEKEVADLLPAFDVWNDWLSNQFGIGVKLGAALLSRLNPFIAKYPSAYIRYMGLDVGPDGKGTSRRKDHMVMKEYVAKNGEIKKKKSLTYNPWLKSKFVSTCTMNFRKKSVKNIHRRQMYDNYLNRYQNHPEHKDKPKAHLAAMAMRPVMKQFLIEFWTAQRSSLGLELSLPYHVAKLGLSDHKDKQPGHGTTRKK